MPRRYKRYGKRNRRFSRNRGTGKSTTKRIKRVERSVKRINRSIETKAVEYFTTSYVTVQGTTTWYDMTSLIQQGTGRDERVGTQIKVTSVDIVFSFIGASQYTTASDWYNNIRIMLVCDKMPRTPGTSPSMSGTVIQTVDSIGNTIPQEFYPMALYNWENRQRYRILWDKQTKVTGWATSSPTTSYYWDPASSATRTVKKIGLKINRICTFDDTSVECIKNALWLGLFSDSSAPPSPSYQLMYRVKYRDL